MHKFLPDFVFSPLLFFIYVCMLSAPFKQTNQQNKLMCKLALFRRTLLRLSLKLFLQLFLKLPLSPCVRQTRLCQLLWRLLQAKQLCLMTLSIGLAILWMTKGLGSEAQHVV